MRPLLGPTPGGLAEVDPSQLSVTLPRFHDLRRRLEDLRHAVDDDRCGRVGAALPEVEAATAAGRLVDVAEDLGERVPVRTAHFDAKLDNFLFHGDRAVCLVDLDTVMPGAWFWDVGDLLRSAATTAAEDAPDPTAVAVEPPLYDAVVAGYRSSVPPGLLTPAEWSAIDVAGAISTYEQALRFLTDWLAGDVYFRTTRPGQEPRPRPRPAGPVVDHAGPGAVSPSIDRLDRDRLPEIDRLCRRAVVGAPSLDELEGALFAPDQPAAVLGDPDVGVVAVVDCDDGAHVRLLAVHPSERRRGHGSALLRAAEGWATRAGHRSLVIGADPPYFLWPGVPGTETALLCLLERRHYVRTETNFNMRIDLGSIPPDPAVMRWPRPTNAPRSTTGWPPTGPTGDRRSCGPSTRATWCWPGRRTSPRT